MGDNLRQRNAVVIAPNYDTFLRYVTNNERLAEKGFVFHTGQRKYFETPGENIYFYLPSEMERLRGARLSRAVVVNNTDRDLIEELQTRLEDPVLTKVRTVEV